MTTATTLATKFRPLRLRISGACLSDRAKLSSARALPKRVASNIPDARHSCVHAGHSSLASTGVLAFEDVLPAKGTASALMKSAGEVTRAELSSYAILAACAVMQGVLCAMLMGDLPSNLLRTIAILLK